MIQKIAQANGVMESEVQEAIESAIKIGYAASQNNDTWKELFGEGVLPTPEEFIIGLVAGIAQSQENN